MDPRLSVIDHRLKNVKRIIAIASGKGGVGKSVTSATLALLLAKKGYNVGLLDLDLYGPSTHIILGVKNVIPTEEKGVIPPNVNGIKFMSIVYYAEDKPTPLRGHDVSNAIIELLTITRWENLDFLIVDMPPGIGDETLDTIRLIKRGEFLVVTTPSKVALYTVEKLLILLKELNVPILGVLENMKMDDSDFIERNITRLNIKYLGAVHFDKKFEDAVGSSEKLLQTDFSKELAYILEKIL